MTHAATLPLRSPLARWRDERVAGAERVWRAVLSWEGVTARGGRARLGRHDLGRLPRGVRPWEADRVIAKFRERYEAAADEIDRAAGVREGRAGAAA